MASQFQKKHILFLVAGSFLLLGFQNCSKTGFSTGASNVNAQKSNLASTLPISTNVPVVSRLPGTSVASPSAARTPGSVVTPTPMSPSQPAAGKNPMGGANPVVARPVVIQPVVGNNSSSTVLPTITATLTPTTMSGEPGAELVYTIGNVNHMSDSFTIDVTDKTNNRAAVIGNILECHVTNQANCSIAAGSSLRFLYSTYLRSKPSDFFTVLITATNSKGTVTYLMPFTYKAPAAEAAPIIAPVACSYTYTATQACQANNTQTVSAVGSPLGCVGTPATTQSCAGPQAHYCPGQMFSMASQSCVSQCVGTEVVQISEFDDRTQQSALNPIGYNIIAGFQFTLNGTDFVLGQKTDSDIQTLTSLGNQVLSSRSHSDFVSAFTASINADSKLAGRVTASLGGDFTVFNSRGDKVTGKEILLKSADTFSLPARGFYIRNLSQTGAPLGLPSATFGTTVYCKD